MRRLFILGLLYGGLQLVLPLGDRSAPSQSLLTFGFLILSAYTVAEIAAAVRLPKIVGYLVAGLAFGPPGLGVVSSDVVNTLAPVSALAIALIAFLAGAELQWSEVRERGVVVLKMLTGELLVAFIGIAATLYLLRGLLPFLATAPAHEAVAFAVLFASVAIVHSPAVTLALLSESGARGPVARTTLGIVLVADVAVVLFFSGALAFARALAPPASTSDVIASSGVLWEIGGAVLVGAVLGAAVALYLRFVNRELFIFAILVTFFGSEIARLAHVETLLTLITAGFVAENAGGGRGDALRRAMERAAAPVFVVFFALAGAKIQPAAIVELWPLVIPIVLVRAGGIALGVRLGAWWARVPAAESRYVWMGLISQAGVAIGLATIVADVYPGRGEQMRTLFLAIIAVNESIGPVLFRQALVRSGEAPLDERDDRGLRVATAPAH